MPTHAIRTGLLALLLTAISAAPLVSQPSDRIRFNNQDLFLSGANVAWVDYARDIGRGPTNLAKFERMFRELREHGGNSMRFWLHIDGRNTPQWQDSTVVGPGVGAIRDIRNILDLAWEYDVGLLLSVWSHDMLRISIGPIRTERNKAILTDSTLTRSYIDNALVPMVDSLKGHPAIIAWEIFNEPEGITFELGWNGWDRVAMADIQRFINMTAGAIHRTDSSAQVTNGAWSFTALTDIPVTATSKSGDQLSIDELSGIQGQISAKYRHNFSLEDTKAFYDGLRVAARNYYTDERLIDAGGDPDGILDFHTVHYYEWAGTALSPFHHSYDHWQLNKALAIGEFFMGPGNSSGSDGDPDAVYGVPWEDLYTKLFDTGYAGAFAWQWYNYPVGAEGVVNWPRMLEGMELLRTAHPEAVSLYRGLRIALFRAEPDAIEAGQSSLLSWITSGGSSVLLDGVAVDSIASQAVSPAATTTYTLEVTGRGSGEVRTQTVTITVSDPTAINRAASRPVTASTFARCCGETLSPNLAVDGDLETRWSSAWDPSEADEDPDDEWIAVELDSAYVLDRVVLQWDSAFAVAYAIDVSLDAQAWTVVYSDSVADGDLDDFLFDDPPMARYVRMRGIARGTDLGYGLREFEVYGRLSDMQPPDVTLSFPAQGAVLSPGADATLTAVATDPDGSIQRVEFLANGSQIGSTSEEPFTFDWSSVPEGEHLLTAVATDDDSLSVSSPSVAVFAIDASGFPRYESETATLEGDTFRESMPTASGRAYAFMRESGSITFEVNTDGPGLYLLVFRYQLPFSFKIQYLNLNGERWGEVDFDGPIQRWLTRAVKVPLRGGTNTIQIEKSWGWMYFDFISVGNEAVNVAAEIDGPPGDFELGENYPNPFAEDTRIEVTLPETRQVTLSVFDLTGRKLATLTSGLLPAGSHVVTFQSDDLPSGVYFYRLEAGPWQQTRRMIVVR